MIAIYFLLALLSIGVGFLVWRALMRSPKTDKFFDLSLRGEEDADMILRRRKNANKDLKTRGRTLGKRERFLQSEIQKLKDNE